MDRMTIKEAKAGVSSSCQCGRKASKAEVNSTEIKQRESVRVLQECISLQESKSRDYQNPYSSVVQAMHYRRGIDTIHDMIHQKLLRAQSLLESASGPKHEPLEDTYIDIINYCSFAVSYLRRAMDGQNQNHDIFNRNTLKDVKNV